MPDGVVWLPMRSPGSEVRAGLGTGPGGVVRLSASSSPRPFPQERPDDRRPDDPSAIANDQPTLASFGHDVWWIVLIKVLGIFVLLVVMTLFAIVFERKVVARMQQRLGPNRVGPRGLLQSLADGLKLAFKEDIMPALADKPVYFLAPVISAIPAFLAFSVIPFGPTGQHLRPPHPAAADRPARSACCSCSPARAIGVYGIVLAGWASGSTYPLLGGLRCAAQMISYEVAMGLSLVAVFLYAGSLSTSEIVAAQQHASGSASALLPASFVIYVIADGRGDQPRAVRPARGRERARRRLPHRVLAR